METVLNCHIDVHLQVIKIVLVLGQIVEAFFNLEIPIIMSLYQVNRIILVTSLEIISTNRLRAVLTVLAAAEGNQGAINT